MAADRAAGGVALALGALALASAIAAPATAQQRAYVIAISTTEGIEPVAARVGAPVDTFCYPRGHFDERAKDAVRAAGFRIACTTMPGCVTPRTHPFSLRRTFIARDDSLRDFARKLDGSFDLLHAARQRLGGGAPAPSYG